MNPSGPKPPTFFKRAPATSRFFSSSWRSPWPGSSPAAIAPWSLRSRMSPLWRPLQPPSRPRVRLRFQCLLPERPRFRFLCPPQRRLRLRWIPPSPRSPFPRPLRPRSPQQLQLQRPRQFRIRRRALPLLRSQRRFQLQLQLPSQPLLLQLQAPLRPRSPRQLPPQLQLQLQLLNQRLPPLPLRPQPLPLPSRQLRLLPSDCWGGWAVTLSRPLHRQRQDLAGTLS